MLIINKIIIASFAFVFSHWQKLLEISILPLLLATPLLLLLPDLLPLINLVLTDKNLPDIELPDYLSLYILLFFYAYIHLAINVYRLVSLGGDAVRSFVPIVDFKKIMRFVGLTLFIALATTLPVMLSGLYFLQLVVYFLLMPLMLNFVNIAIDKPLKYKWNLSLNWYFNLFLLQIIFPALITILHEISGIDILFWPIKIIVFYWTLISLSLCYQLITAK